MQQKLVDGFVQGLLDPRFQGLIGEFYAVRTRLVIQPNGKLLTHLQALLLTLSTILEDQYSLQQLQAATGGVPAPEAVALPPDVDVTEVLSCMDGLRDLVSGPAFSDTAAVLFILCGKLKLEDDFEANDAGQVLSRLDDFLGLIGLREVSILQLWQNATGVLTEQRECIFRAVMDVLMAVQGECSVEG